LESKNWTRKLENRFVHYIHLHF